VAIVTAIGVAGVGVDARACLDVFAVELAHAPHDVRCDTRDGARLDGVGTDGRREGGTIDVDGDGVVGVVAPAALCE
jgi:hypothetical protein